MTKGGADNEMKVSRQDGADTEDAQSAPHVQAEKELAATEEKLPVAASGMESDASGRKRIGKRCKWVERVVRVVRNVRVVRICSRAVRVVRMVRAVQR